MLNTEVLEARILGTIFLDPSLAPDIISVIHLDMFQSSIRNRNVFRMITWLVQKGHEATIDNIAIYFENDLEKVGGLMQLGEMMWAVGNVHQIQDTLKKFIEMDARRKWSRLIEDFKERAADPKNGAFEELLDEFEQKALEIRPKVLSENSNIDSIINWYEDLVLKMNNPSRAFGMMTQWSELDRLTLGLQRADFSVVGARTSIGKSAFANEVSLRISGQGYKVAEFSLEMNKSQIYNRKTSSLTGLSLQALRVGNVTMGQLEKVADVMDRIRRIHVDDTRGITTEYITSEMRRLKRQEGLDLVIIDYLQEIVEPEERSDNQGSSIKRICQKLRQAAKDCDCHVMGLSQLKQEVDVRQNKRPFISDFSGGKAIADIADLAILLYRDEYYNPDTSDRGIMEVNLAKQRNGPTGMVKMNFDKGTQRITTGGKYVEQVAGL